MQAVLVKSSSQHITRVSALKIARLLAYMPVQHTYIVPVQ